MEDKKIPFKFETVVTDSMTPTTDPELKIGKVRVFYKGLNRNGSFINNRFGDQLAVTAYSKPIIGSYDVLAEDFQGHEMASKSKAYGYVIPNSLQWVDHLDSDGIVRNYAQYDVLIWAKYWKEAQQIFAKTQSMEIDPDTIKGDWTTINNDGDEAYEYSAGIIAGLTVLGDRKTPCFEGAAFFSTSDEEYQQFTAAIEKYLNGGNTTMEDKQIEQVFEEKPALEDEEVAVAEEQPVEAVEEAVEAVIEPVEEQPAEEQPVEVVESPAENTEAEVEVQAEVEAETPVEETAQEQEATEAEPEAENFEEKYNEVAGALNALTEANSALQQQFDELKVQYEELQATFKEIKSKCEQMENVFAEKDSTISSQAAIIASYEVKQKEQILDKFNKCLPADLMQSIASEADKLSVEELNTRCAVEYTNFSMAKEMEDEIRIPQPPQEEPALFKILNRYKKH